MLTTQNVILILSSLGAFITIMALALPFLQTDSYGSRLKYLARRRQELQEQQQQRFQQQSSIRRRTTRTQTLMSQALARLNLLEAARSGKIRNRMIQAGYRTAGAPVAYAFARMVLPVVFAGLAALVLFSSASLDWHPFLKVLICVGAAGAGYLIPGVLVSNAITKRKQEIVKGFPDALDLTVICIEAGISLEQAFVRVSQELGEMSPILADEFSITTAELAYLADRRMALENFASRTGAEPVRALTTSLIQSEKYGTPLTLALRVLSRENREERMARAEQKAGALPAALTVPMILFFLPVLFIVLMGPAVIQVIQTFQK